MSGSRANRRHRPIGYFFVAAGCLLLHNAIVIAGDALGQPLWLSMLVSFVIVNSVGYMGHCRVTFRAPATPIGFVRYAAAMSTNAPAAYALIWLLHDAVGLPMVLAAPAASALMLAINYLLSRWAIVQPRRRGIA
ncbi:GtrA family protein [Novosphingobium sp.]|uniref:GtrA family protein n=1 Tax=Novosphingobium sp. TaxID=1874826 RepID=UPI0038BDFA98